MSIFSTEEQNKIIHAINIAENQTSGEIRLAVERTLKGTSLERAQFFFEKLGMHKTTRRNGVLIYLAVDDNQFAIIGDSGIDKQVPSNFWNQTKEAMLHHFRKGSIVNGIIVGIDLAGEQLSTYFPIAKDDINELPNDIYYGDQ